MKKGDASMVAAVLLIISAVVIGVLVISFSRETEKKVEERILTMGNAIECDDVGIGIEELDSDTLRLTNKGTLGINKIAVRYFAGSPGSIQIENWNPDLNSNGKLDPGLINTLREYYDFPIPPNTNKIEFIPVIFTDDGEEIGCENYVTWER